MRLSDITHVNYLIYWLEHWTFFVLDFYVYNITFDNPLAAINTNITFHQYERTYFPLSVVKKCYSVLTGFELTEKINKWSFINGLRLLHDVIYIKTIVLEN